MTTEQGAPASEWVRGDLPGGVSQDEMLEGATHFADVLRDTAGQAADVPLDPTKARRVALVREAWSKGLHGAAMHKYVDAALRVDLRA